MKLYKPSWINHDGHPIFSIDIHPDDIHCATGGQGDDNTGRVVIWNLKAVLAENNDGSIPKQFCKLDHHSACVNCVRWSNSGRYLASGGDDKVIIIWKLVSKYSANSSISSAFETNNLEHWKTVCILRSHEGDVLDLSWSPKDTYLASCSIDNSVKIWDAQNFPQIIATLEGHSSMVKGVTWDPVGKYIATQSVDRTLRIWRTSDWSTEHIVSEPFVDCGGTTHVLRLGWSPDGLYLVSAHAMNYGFPTAQIIERDGWKVDKDFVGHRKAVVCVRFNKNIQENNRVKQCCVALGSRDRSISVWSTALKRPVVVVKDAFSHSVMDLAWSHCGTVMMACSWDGSVLAAQFNWKEIGKPLSQDETESLYQRFYGNSMVMTNTLNVIPNMEVYLARQKAAVNKALEIGPPIAESKISIKTIEKPEEHRTSDYENMNRGPEKQIETRTADGKRRITPKFLPLPADTDQLTSATLREEGVVFLQQDNPSNQDNLRERMVSSIDDVSFGENKGVLLNTLNKTNCSSIQPEQSTFPDKKCLNSETANPETDTTSIVNGIQNTQSECVDKKEDSVVKIVNLITVSPKDVNGHHQSSKASDLETKQEQRLTNGFADDENISKVSENHDRDTTASHNNIESDQKAKMRNDQELSAMVIQVKRKRPAEDMKPPQIAKKKFTPQSLRTFTTRKSNKIETNNDEIAIPENHNSTPKTCLTSKPMCSPKTRLSPMKINTVLTLQVNTKPESAYSLEVLNGHQRTDGLCHQLKCKHFPTSMQGLEWVICTDAPICGITGDIHRIVAFCEDATLHILDLKGRYAISPILLSSYPSKHVQSGPFLMVITTKAYLHLWNIHNKTVVIKSESLLPLLNQPGNESSTGDKTIEIAHVYLAAGGVPVIFLSNGKSFIFNKDMGSWSLFTDSRGLVSSPIMPDVDDLAAVTSVNKIWGRKKRPEPAIVSHIKLQLIKATEMKKSNSIQQWIIVLAKTLATHGLDKELHILCEDLLGPTHSSAKPGTTWLPKIADCVDKRVMLRGILDSLLEDLRWQDFYCEFDELLKELEDSTPP